MKDDNEGLLHFLIVDTLFIILRVVKRTDTPTLPLYIMHTHTYSPRPSTFLAEVSNLREVISLISLRV